MDFELLNGHQAEPQRSAAIQRFKDGGRDKARVLLMSSVGTVGLNLTCAHIVIFLVSLSWSHYIATLTLYIFSLVGHTLVGSGR